MVFHVILNLFFLGGGWSRGGKFLGMRGPKLLPHPAYNPWMWYYTTQTVRITNVIWYKRQLFYHIIIIQLLLGKPDTIQNHSRTVYSISFFWVERCLLGHYLSTSKGRSLSLNLRRVANWCKLATFRSRNLKTVFHVFDSHWYLMSIS